VAGRMLGDPRVRRAEAGLLFGACVVVMLAFVIASSGG
jgi:hypothetical protein